MNKLTLIDVSPYLPYEVKVKTGSTVIRELVVDIPKDEEIRKYVPIQYVINGMGHSLILYPISDLVNEIIHKGEKFIPLLVLAKLEDPNNNYLIDDANGNPLIGRDESDFHEGSMTFAHTHKFFYDNELKGFAIDLLDEDGTLLYREGNADENFKLMQKLFEWRFDVSGLIERGLAIDVNTLESEAKYV